MKSPPSCPQLCPLIPSYSCNTVLFSTLQISWALCHEAMPLVCDDSGQRSELGLKWGQNNYTGAMFLALTAPCVTQAGYRYTEKWGVVTVNSPDTRMHSAVKRYTAPFITAPRAQRGHKYQRFLLTPCSTNRFQHTFSLPLSIILPHVPHCL